MAPGGILHDRFEALRQASSGGMSTVYRARDRVAGVEVALKVLRGSDAREVERFMREAAILSQLSHPGIVRYVAHGTARSGEHFLAMEWLEGEDLSIRLARRGLSMAESVLVTQRAAEALAFAHARDLVHRDLKPSNLFLVRGDVDRVVVLDFGIARLARDGHRLTRTGAFLGTPGYIAPEQIEGPPASDPRADVFALGAVLFECLTGRPAFDGTTAMSVLAKILLQEVPRVRALRPSVPLALDDLVARMMARDPAERPPDCAAVLEEIARLGDPAALPGGAAPAVDARRWSSAEEAPGALTLREQRLVTVVLAGEVEADGGADEARISARPELCELRAAIEPHGGVLHGLSGGSLVVTFWSNGSAVDRAARAARCALTLGDLFPSLPVCVVTGRGLVSARVVAGEMLDRGARSLARARPGAVRVDEVTAGMLRSRFHVEVEDTVADPAKGDRDAGDPRTLASGDPARSHLLRAERAAAEGAPSLLGQTTPWVGRTRELSMLEGVLAGTISESVASAVLVIGEPGAGKSRLRRELLEILRVRGDRVEVLSGAGDPMSTGSPYRMIADALRRAAGIREGDSLEVGRTKLRARVARHLEGGAQGPASAPPSSGPRTRRATRTIPFLGELAGTPFSDAGDEALVAARQNARLMGDQMRGAWEAFLAAECAAAPVLLVLDDLQWGDAATVRLVDTTLRNLRDLPLMILALARPEVHERFPNLWPEREIQSIKLGPLPRRSSEQIVRAAMGAAAPAEVVRDLVDRAQGNPFYLEELVRAVAAGRAGSADGSERLALPASVLGMVEARLDAEGAEAKRVLRAASVFGDRFTLGGVVALLGGAHHADEVAGWLEGLVAHEIVAPVSSRGIATRDAVHLPPSNRGVGAPPSSGRGATTVPASGPGAGAPPSSRRSAGAPASGPGAGGPPSSGRGPGSGPISSGRGAEISHGVSHNPAYVFCHTLVREAAYATLTEPDRALGHRLAGAWLSSAPQPGVGDAMTIAEHLRRGDDPAGAARWYRRAAEQALEADDLPAAVERAALGVASGAGGDELGHLRLIQAEAQLWLGDLAAAEESGLEAAAALPAGSMAWFRAVTQAAVAAGKHGGFDRVDARAALTLSTAPAPGARAAQIVCLAECAAALLVAGRFVASDTILAHLRRVVRDPAALGPAVGAHLHRLGARRALHAGDPCAALEGFEAALGALEAAGDRRAACAVRSDLGVIFAELGDHESAVEALREALEGAERMGLGELGPVALASLGHALAYRGRLDEARAVEERAVEAFQRLGDPRMEGVARSHLARITLASGDPVSAEREARLACEQLRVAPPMRAAALAVLARALLAQENVSEALSAAREARATLDELGEVGESESLVRLVHAEALAAAGLREERDRALVAARERLLLRADRITAASFRERFLTAVPENAKTLALSERLTG